MLKLFDKVILILWGDQLSSGSLQMGYKKNSSTAQCSYMMSETISYFLNNGSNPIMVALDMSSAFDVMFTKIEARLPAVIVRALSSSTNSNMPGSGGATPASLKSSQSAMELGKDLC